MEHLLRISVYMWLALTVLCGACRNASDEREMQSPKLVGEDFATGLLRADLSAPQSKLMDSWALARGFDRYPKDNVKSEDFRSWAYVRPDGLKLSYAYMLSWRGPLHDITLQFEDPLHGRIDPVDGVPVELIPGSDLTEVVNKWGIESAHNRREMKRYRSKPTPAGVLLVYTAQSDGIREELEVRASRDRVWATTLVLSMVAVDER